MLSGFVPGGTAVLVADGAVFAATLE